jgi:hypothetical protein
MTPGGREIGKSGDRQLPGERESENFREGGRSRLLLASADEEADDLVDRL